MPRAQAKRTGSASHNSASALDPSGTGAAGEPGSVDERMVRYDEALRRSPLAAASRRNYRAWVRRYLDWLSARPIDGPDPLADPAGRDWAVRDFRASLKESRLAPATVNLALAAIDHLYRTLGMRSPDVGRERIAQPAPRALDEDQLRRLLRIVDVAASPRDRAVVGLLGFAGLRVGEVAALHTADLSISARAGEVTVRRGKGDRYRVVPLAPSARRWLAGWLTTRGVEPGPLFPGPAGDAITTRSLARAVSRLGALAGLDGLSAHVLRHTWATRLVRRGTDLVLVAELAGHARIETTRRYALPSAADRQAAVDLAACDY